MVNVMISRPLNLNLCTWNYTNVQVLACNGVYTAPSEQKPDCKYVESPIWEDELDGDWNDKYDGFKVPIGVCLTTEGSDGVVSRYLYIYI